MDIEQIINDMENEGNVAGYQYFSLLQKRIILFNDECNDSIVEKVGMPLLAFDKDSSNAPVHLYISSEGGSTFSSLYLCDIIDNYSKTLYIHIMGYALSMGFLLACAGANNPNVHKDCYPFSTFMMHAGSISLSGNAANARRFMEFEKKLEDKTKKYVLTHTNMTEETYDKYNDDDYWMTAEEALQYGVIDKIIGGGDCEK